jgi:nucleoside-diphosphate-sugar epimerase
MPRLLIAGCGYLGRVVADLFLSAGYEIEGWTVSADSAQQLANKPYPVCAVDISDPGDVRAQKADFDAVIHSASTRGGAADSYERVYLNGVRNLLNRFANARLLFVSSTSVYAQNDGSWVTEESIAEPNHETGKILRRAEESVLEKSGSVVRLGGIYGPGRSALLRRCLAGEAAIGPQNNRFVNQIHRDDAAAAIQFLFATQESAGQICNVVDNEPILLSECYRWLATKLNRSLPSAGESRSSRKRGESNKRVSNAKLRALGWSPRYSTFAEGMEKSVLGSFDL